MRAQAARALVARVGPALGLLALAVSFVVAANLFGTREALFGSATPAPRAAAFSRIEDAPARSAKTVLRSQPWWQQVGRYRGNGPSKPDLIRIADHAIQWRVTWQCSGGRFVVRSAGASKPLIDEGCGAQRTTELVEKLEGPLRIEADGRWRARVEQQVDVPLIESPLPAMRAPGTRAVASGRFYRIDQVGRGRLTIYRLASGRYALRLRDFYVTPNVDLDIRLSPLRAPRTTRQYLSAPAKRVAPLDVTTGSMNFVLPAGVEPSRYRSVVIWCPLITSAYAAATLKHVR